MAIDFDIIHASGRFDLVSRFLRADFTTWFATTDASIISGTEWDRLTTAQREAIMGGPDWDHHAQGGNGAAWRVDTWDLASTDYVKLSELQYRTVTGKLFPKFHATVIVLRHKATGQLLTLLVVHMPTRGTARRRAVWDDVARGLVALIQVTKGPVVVAADFNAGWRKADLQKLLVESFLAAGVEFGWAGRVPAGVRISMIDGHAVRGLTVRFSRLLPAAKAAEAFHRPVLIGLTLPTPTAPTPPKETVVAKLPSNLPQILRDAGLKVVEEPGWRDRDVDGPFNPVGVLCHHTATTKRSAVRSVISLLVKGRGKPNPLAGPLCQLGLDRDGTVHLVAAGRANHAGNARKSGTVAAGNGNTLYIGIEAFNDGVGEPWPPAQYDAYVLLCAVLSVKVTGNSAETVRAHKETSVTGKIDPTFPMDPFRKSVAKKMVELRGGTTPTKEAPVLNNVQKARVDIAEAIAEVNRARALLSKVDQSRIAVRSQFDDLAAVQVKLAAILQRLPEA